MENNKFSALDEKELLAGFNRRETEVFCALYERYYNELFYFATRLFVGVNDFTAQDVLQDLFLKVWEGKKEFESFDELKGYLYAAIRNRRRNYAEHVAVVRQHEEAVDMEPADELIFSTMVESETLAILYHHINQLPRECARVVRLSLSGHKNQEIAEMLSISIHTVYSQRQKALNLLRLSLPKELLLLLLSLMS